MDSIDFGQPGWGAKLEQALGLSSIEEVETSISELSTRKRARSSCESSTSRAKAVLRFGRFVGDLKHVPRTGWVNRKVPGRVESVAEHSYRCAALGLCLSKQELRIDKVVGMALVHDLAECIVGDIAPGQGISDSEKQQLERDAMNKIMKQVEDPKMFEELHELWEEYEARVTPEARAVKDLDRFEMVLQADEYESRTEGLDLSEFFASVQGKITHPQVREWYEELVTERKHRIAKT